jgi:hypothetical protein
MADDLEFASIATRGQGIAVSGENILQGLPGTKIAKRLSRIEHLGNSQQMTLLADAVASGGLKLRRIDDRTRPGIAEVFFLRAVTAFAGDAFRRKRGGPILVQRAGNGQSGSGMAK